MRPVLVATVLLFLAPLATAALPAPVPVAAAGFSFVSPALVVPTGTTIAFVGAALPHTVTSAADANAAAAGTADGRYRIDLPMGTTGTHTFTQPGTYAYFCELHYRLGMVGAVVVV